MAASVKNMVRMSDDKSSSSEDDEALRRCREAVWESRTAKDEEEDKVKESKRVVVADHEHDGNELQVSQGFQKHVAKKLGHFLDSCISETKSSSCVASAKCDDEDEGFRLFSTSVPGQTEEPPAPVRRRPIPSSSDSDSEMESRLREAAVSVKDLLPASALPSAFSPSSTQPPGSGKIKKKENAAEEEEEECQIVKKKKKKKRRRTAEENVQVDCAPSLNTEQEGSEQQHPQVRVKPKKEKKSCEGNTMD